jgi:Domain of unknown function (DUF4158)
MTRQVFRSNSPAAESHTALVRYFTLTAADVAFVDPGRGRGPGDRLGLAVQLCTLPWLGFVPDEVTAAPPVAVTRLAERLAIDPAELQGYGRREQTRTGHLWSAAGYLGWKQAPPGGAAMKELAQFLLDRAMEHDSPALLFNLAAEYLISAQVIRPGVVTLMEMVGAARAGAGELTFAQVAHLLTGRCARIWTGCFSSMPGWGWPGWPGWSNRRWRRRRRR